MKKVFQLFLLSLLLMLPVTIVRAEPNPELEIKSNYNGHGFIDWVQKGKHNTFDILIGSKTELRLIKGEKQTLYKSKNAKWTVSNKNVAKLKKISKNKYQLIPKKAGKTKITVKIGKKKYKLTAIFIKKALSTKCISVKYQEKKQIDMLDNGKQVNDKTTWKIKNDKIATIDENGKFYGRQPGETEIIATYQGKTYKAKLLVYDNKDENGNIIEPME